ncbi:hypothetical protein [Lamprocystis purpurea]|jgi:hypothetical protein|uniref:hypothetical protein n=1 Tax=Lamprocystis purpurea TaxID=61598 RepID=UPI00037C8BF5|nr:hypothetical protein [Lamprocystis purpurea]
MTTAHFDYALEIPMSPLPFDPPPHSGSPTEPPLVNGPHFTYRLPPGWTVGEEGKFSLVLRSPDFIAAVIVFGQSGMMQPLSPEQFAYYAMTGVMRLAPDVQFGPSRPIQPMPGYTHSATFETTYTLNGPAGAAPVRGVVVSNVSIGYGQCNGVLTLAGSDARHWPHYSGWLPRVAMAALNTGPDPYGRHTVAGMITDIGRQDGESYRQHQAWSQQLWGQVTADRNRSSDGQQEALGAMLDGHVWIPEGFGGQPIRRSTTPACIWRSRDGREIPSDDPAFDPRTPGDVDWVRVR